MNIDDKVKLTAQITGMLLSGVIGRGGDIDALVDTAKEIVEAANHAYDGERKLEELEIKNTQYAPPLFPPFNIT